MATTTPRNGFLPLLLDSVLRLLAAGALAIFAWRTLNHWLADPLRITLILLVVSECLNVGLALVARLPRKRDWRLLSVLFTLAAMFYFLALDLKPGLRLIPEWMGVFIQCLGVSWQFFAKISLGRAFGLLPGDRGIVETGAYRWVRHPIYSGYFTDHIGFFLANFNIRNFVIFALLYSIQVMRALREEDLLLEQESYRQYCRKVRYRFIPFVI